MAKVAKTFLKKKFTGFPKEEYFELSEQKLRAVEDGEFLLEVHYLSVDPYMRLFIPQLADDAPIIGTGVGKVIESKNPDFPVDAAVFGPTGWTSHVIVTKSMSEPGKDYMQTFRILPDDIKLSHALGILGMPGLSAYFGLLDICKPKEGETVFVNAAAGAVGNVVGQIAKMKGCRVVGCAGSDKKIEYLKEIGFDAVFNYKNADFKKTLTELCPKGIDCFFENVGGSMFDAVIKHMNDHGRISICGSISGYNEVDEPKGPYVHVQCIFRNLRIKGFHVGRKEWLPKFDKTLTEIKTWITEGKLKACEHVIEEFENMPKAFISLFRGEHFGKVVVKVK